MSKSDVGVIEVYYEKKASKFEEKMKKLASKISNDKFKKLVEEACEFFGISTEIFYKNDKELIIDIITCFYEDDPTKAHSLGYYLKRG